MKRVTDQGMSRTQVARDLGMNPATLYRWLQAATAPPAVTEPAAPSRAELAQLRRANAHLRLERAILRQARGICSRMPQ
ncbi:MAG: transposase [Chloroflexaceae bacterium]|nr:transposase [Chloroflexaceae bacterium]